MFKIYFLLSLAGQLFMLLLSIALFYKNTPQLNYKATLKAYFNPYVIMTGMAQFILQVVFTFLLTIDGGGWLIKTFSGGQIPDNIPLGFYFFAFLSGAFSNIFAIMIGKFMKADTLLQYFNPTNIQGTTVSDSNRSETPSAIPKETPEALFMRRNAVQNNVDRNRNSNRMNEDVFMIDSLSFVNHEGTSFTDPTDGIIYKIKKVTEIPFGKLYFGIDPYSDIKGKQGDYIGINHIGLCKIITAGAVEGLQG